MSLTIQVPLTKKTYRRIEKWAKMQQMEMGEIVAGHLDDTFPDIPFVPPAEFDPILEKEKKAFIDLHPQLKAKYFDQFVAIYKGELIDHDSDYGTLLNRVDAQYPDTFVWVAKVEDKPVREFVVRSPRFIHNL